MKIGDVYRKKKVPSFEVVIRDVDMDNGPYGRVEFYSPQLNKTLGRSVDTFHKQYTIVRSNHETT